jgi:hypothetical protein
MDQRRAGAGRDIGGIAVLLTATCAAAIHRAAAAGDVASVAFVAVSYAALLLLHRTLGAYETAIEAPEDAAAAESERERLRRRLWALSALLTALFAWKVAGVVPWPAGVLVWTAAATTSAGGSFALVPRRRP